MTYVMVLHKALKHATNYAEDNQITDMRILWTEPEKVDLVGKVRQLYDAAVTDDADLIVPSRNSLNSYPLAQQWSESFGNQRHSDHGYLDINENAIDTFFGPKMWHVKVNRYFEIFGDKKVAEELANMRLESIEKTYKLPITDSMRAYELARAQKDLQRSDHMMHMPTCLLILHRYDVLSLPMDYTHPAKQTVLENAKQSDYNGKRIMQLNALDEQFALVKRIDQKEIFNKEL